MSVLEQADALNVEGYAEAVRRSLADLGPELVDDLTEDLEADLADAMADERHVAHGRGLLEQFGPPEEYAAELRTAAGLAPAQPAAAQGWRRFFPDPIEDADRFGRWTLRRLRAYAWWPPTESFLLAVRPVWWLVRGWVAYQAVAYVLGSGRIHVVPAEPATWAVLVLAVILSVQWGRGAWFQTRSVRWVAVVANAAAVVLLLPVYVTMQGQAHQRDDVYDAYVSGGFGGGGSQIVYQDKPVDGVVVDGMLVSNLFVYDADGNPLRDVQVYDDRGRPVRTTYDDGFDQYWFPEGTEPWSFVSRTDADGRARWNVYPLQGAPTSTFEHDDEGALVLPAGTSATTPPWPFAKAPALDAPADAAIGADGPTASPGPSPSATPTGAQ